MSLDPSEPIIKNMPSLSMEELEFRREAMAPFEGMV